MASICSRCALRLQRAAAAESRVASRRSFSSTPFKRRGLAKFTETSQPELDNVLSTLRDKHFLPAALSNRERNLIFKPKNRKLIEDNPTSVTMGDEDFQLQHIDRMNDIPSRHDLIPQAIKLMAQGESKDWSNLPALLSGLHQAKMTPADQSMAKMIYMATSCGRFGTILQCLHQAHNTGMTMKKNKILNAVIWSLHHIGQMADWSESALEKAIRDANEVAMQLEDEEHGTGRFIQANDPRRRPYVLGTFLELAAVQAFKFQDGKDIDGKVKAYSERLLSNIEGHEQVNISLHCVFDVANKLHSSSQRLRNTNLQCCKAYQSGMVYGLPGRC